MGPIKGLLPSQYQAPSVGDLVAGASVALVAIPQSLAYAKLAGLPAHYGLYASALPSVLAALFVSSKYLQTGPVALTALLSFGALSAVADPFSSEYIQLAALLALLVGLMRLAFGIFRLGRVNYLLSDPVMSGFTTGAAVLIIASQLPGFFGIGRQHDNVLLSAFRATIDPGQWQTLALAFSIVSMVVILVGRRLAPLFPGVLLSVVLSIAVSSFIAFDGLTVGQLDSKIFPPIGFGFLWSRVPDLLLPALAIALVGFAEPASIARNFAAIERLKWDANKEMFGQGVANVASAVSGGFPVGGSFSRSSLNRMAGATSPWAGAITGILVLLSLPLVPLLAALPMSVLSTVVILAVWNLIKLPALFSLVRQSVPQAIVALGTLVATLLTAPRVERGILFGIGLAIAVHLYREMSTVEVQSRMVGEILRVEPKGVLWFATVPEVDYKVRNELAKNPNVEAICFDFSGVGRLDYTGAAAIARLAADLSDGGVGIRLENVPPGAQRSTEVHLGHLL